MKPILEVTIADGKYTVIHEEGKGLRALRYGEEWRDCCGDGLVYQLACEVDALRQKLKENDRVVSMVVSNEKAGVVVTWLSGHQDVIHDAQDARRVSEFWGVDILANVRDHRYLPVAGQMQQGGASNEG